MRLFLRSIRLALLWAVTLPAGLNAEPHPRTDRYGDPLPPGAIARLGTLRFRGVRGALAFSPDGKLLAAATGKLGEHVTLWDVATGREVRQIAGTAYLRRLAFSADGKRLACSTASAQCRVIDLTNGKELFTVEGFHGHFSADGKLLVTADASSDPAKVHVWEAATGRLLREWAAGRSVEALSLSADGRTLALIDNAAPVAVAIHDPIKGVQVRSFQVAGGRAPKLALSPDGKTLATADTNGVRLWNTAEGKLISHWNHHVLSPAVFSPDGKRLAWIGSDVEANRLWIVEREGGKPKAIGGPVNSFEPPCFTPNGKLLAVVTDARAVSLRDSVRGTEAMSTDAHARPVIDLAISPDGHQVVSRAGDDVRVWETHTGKPLRRLPLLPPGHKFMTPLLSGGHLLTEDSTTDRKRGPCCLRDMRTGEEVLRFEGRPDAVAALGGRFVGVRGRRFSEFLVLDVRARRCVYRVPDVPDSVLGAQLSSDGDVLVWGRRLAAGIEVHAHRHAAEKAIIFRALTKDDQMERTLADYPCLSPDGRWLVLATKEGRLRRWDLTTGEEEPPLAEAFRITWNLCWSPDGRLVAAFGSDSTGGEKKFDNAFHGVRVWDVRTGKRLAHLSVPSRGGLRLQFTHDSRALVTTDLQGIIHLWEVATGKERVVLKGHLPGGIGALALSANGRLLVSGGHDSQGLVWDLTGRMPDGQWRSVQHPPDKLRAAWEALAAGDARAAYAAMWQLVADAEGSTAFLCERLRPVAPPKPGQVAKLIAALDAEKFAERQRATRELETLEEVAAAELRQVLKSKPTLEVRRRVEALLGRMERVPASEELRALRAIEALEHIGTAEAREVLRGLTGGAPGARLTREAQAARTRLGSREP